MAHVRHFRNKEAYMKWIAYGHIHRDFENTPGSQIIYIHGKKHKVHHSKKSSKRMFHSGVFGHHPKVRLGM